VFAFVRLTWPDKRCWWQMAVPVLLAASALALDIFVKTDYEKIESIVKQSIAAVVAKDVPQLAALVGPDYRDSIHNSKDSLVAFFQRLFSRPLAEKVKKRYSKITTSAPRATCELDVVVHLNPQSDYAMVSGIVFVQMNIHFTQTPRKSWLISSTQINTINNQPINWKAIE